ncbi:sugar ABC transporter ATP-binding protein [Methylocapsa sp. S129]|uniref:sugar ABC transporter ATP-binding protein n=1 Tax=Methylocapsa sp. S129 TaxID=1641869 RepID=UPI00131CEEAA|nr:sugar ABC transporter ATP-binding protein [Methylocapsa sp. S129]
MMATSGSILLEARDITKSFVGTKALVGASLTLRAGQTHALLGANGAGKSTLSRVVSGHVRRDGGTVLYEGRPLDFRSPRDALDAGIAMVMQETSLAPDLSVVENIFLPELRRPGRLSFSSMRRRADEILADLGQDRAVSLDSKVQDISVAQRQLVEIAKALALKSNLIIFDEPTASLSPSEVERLFDIIGRLKEAACAIVFVSHRLEEVFAISDEITVMREGRTVAASRPTSSLNQTELVRLMVGRDLGAIFASATGPKPIQENPILSARSLRAPPLVRDISFDLHRGEILGLGGLVGAGRSEVAEILFGLRQRAGGDLLMDGEPFAPRSPAHAIRAGLGFVAEDRRRQSIVPDLSVRENLLLGHLGAYRGFGLGYRSLDEKIRDLLQKLELSPDRLDDDNLLNFSGGMQQKIIIARWLLLEPKVLILDEPTKGVDIGTRASIYAILREIAARGAAILIISSEFQELLGLADRVVVISDGLSIADVPSGDLDEEKLTLLAAPRSSMERNQRVLRDLAAEHDGAAFWAILDEKRMFCLNCVAANPAADLGFRAGSTARFEETPIGVALSARSNEFVFDPSNGLSSLLVDVKSHRGHELGSIGLVLGPNQPVPAASTLRASIIERFRAAV